MSMILILWYAGNLLLAVSAETPRKNTVTDQANQETDVALAVHRLIHLLPRGNLLLVLEMANHPVRFRHQSIHDILGHHDNKGEHTH